MLQKFKEWWSFTADTIQVVSFVGVTAAGCYAGVVLVVGWLTTIPWFWILAGTPIAGAAFLFMVAQFIRIWRPSEKFKLSDWQGHPIYSIWAAACLWANQRPWPHIPADSPSYPFLQKLKAAIAVGQLKLASGTGNMQSQVAREELLRYANSINERPKFLFPDSDNER